MLQNGDLFESRRVSCGSREIVIENQRGGPEVRNDKGERLCCDFGKSRETDVDIEKVDVSVKRISWLF